MNVYFRLVLCICGFLSAFAVHAKTINEGVSEDRLSYLLNSKSYFILEPPILAMLKIEDTTRKPHYIQIFLALRHEAKASELDYYRSKLRDITVNFFARKTFSYLSSLRGRRLVTFELLKEYQKLMYEETGDPSVEDIEVIELIVE